MIKNTHLPILRQVLGVRIRDEAVDAVIKDLRNADLVEPEPLKDGVYIVKHKYSPNTTTPFFRIYVKGKWYTTPVASSVWEANMHENPLDYNNPVYVGPLPAEFAI